MEPITEEWTKESLEKLSRDSVKWFRFVECQEQRILQRLKKYNNIDTVKNQLEEKGDLTPYQKYKITTVSKFLLQALDVIGTGKYGICLSCQKEIPVQRLLLVPGSLRCMECENKNCGKAG